MSVGPGGPGHAGHPFGGLLPAGNLVPGDLLPGDLPPRVPLPGDAVPRGPALGNPETGGPEPRLPRPGRGPRRRGRALLVVAAGLVTGAVLVWNASDATFTATTSSGVSSWSAGSVAVADDDASTAMFALSNLIPGSTGSRCVVVTYTGSVAASVRLYATAGSSAGTLGGYLDLVVEQGTGGSFTGGCGAFTPGATLYSGTLAGFAAGATSFAAGLGTFAPTGSGQAAVYRFTYTLQDDNAAQGRSGALGFTWEARNT